MGGLMLLDYMFFESGGSARFNPCEQSVDCTCCHCYALGCIWPMKCSFDCSNSQSDDNN